MKNKLRIMTLLMFWSSFALFVFSTQVHPLIVRWQLENQPVVRVADPPPTAEEKAFKLRKEEFLLAEEARRKHYEFIESHLGDE